MQNEYVRMQSPKFVGQCPRLSTSFVSEIVHVLSTVRYTIIKSKVGDPDGKFKILAEIDTIIGGIYMIIRRRSQRSYIFGPMSLFNRMRSV